MIITNIARIDYWARVLFDNPSNVVSIDIKDYNTLWNSSISVCAVKYDFQELSEEDIASIDVELSQVRQGNIGGLLLFFSDNKASPLTVGQMGLFSDALQRNVDADNVIWGVGEGNNGVGTVFVVIFYSAWT